MFRHFACAAARAPVLRAASSVFSSSLSRSSVPSSIATFGTVSDVKQAWLCRGPKKGRAGKSTDDESSEAGGAPMPDVEAVKADMLQQVDRLKKNLAKLRGGEATPNMLDHVSVDAYGTKVPLTSVAHTILRNPSLLVVTPFESAMAQAVATGIRDCGLHLNPIVEDGNVKVPLPKISPEAREASLKALAKYTEEAKQRVRSIRKDAVDALKDCKTVSSDESFRLIKKVQDATNVVTDKLTDVGNARKTEIMNS